MKEEWRDIDGYDGDYQISSAGRIKSFKGKSSLIMSLCSNADGYLMTGLCRRKTKTQHTVRTGRLVAEHFVGGRTEIRNEVNHKNSNRKDDRVENLEWCSRKENILHSHTYGNKSNYGEKNPRATIYDSDAMVIIDALTHLRPMQVVNLFGYKRSIVMQIYSRKNWRHLSVGYEFCSSRVSQKEPVKFSKELAEECYKLILDNNTYEQMRTKLNVSDKLIVKTKKKFGLL